MTEDATAYAKSHARSHLNAAPMCSYETDGRAPFDDECLVDARDADARSVALHMTTSNGR